MEIKVNFSEQEEKLQSSFGDLNVVHDGIKRIFVGGVEQSVENYIAYLDAYPSRLAELLDDANHRLMTDVEKALLHSHINKNLLDTYNQTNSDISDAVSKKHTHTNKELLDTYTQTNSDILDAVTKKHIHTNKELLDTYTQTNSNIADAVTKKHSHDNMNVLNAMEVAYTLDKDAKLLVSTQVQDNHVILNGSILIDGVATIVYDDSEIRQAISKMEVGWVINTKSQITGTEDSDGNFTNVTAITGLDLSLIKIGDNIYVKDTTAPDYWVSGKTNNVLSLNVLDTKTDLSNYYNKTEINALLALKQDSIADLIAIRNGAALGVTAVQPTRKINGKDLSADRTIGAEDIPLDTATGNNVDAALAKLQNDMPTKTSDLINDSGFITTVPVTDVQINGTSIILSGIGNIPIAGDSRLGVVRVRATDGITINDEGRIIINRATNEQIQAKTTTTMPIVPANLDKAIMEGLGNNSLTWSDIYKANARATIGAIGENEGIKIYNLGDDSSGEIPEEVIAAADSGKPYLIMVSGALFIPDLFFEGASSSTINCYNVQTTIESTETTQITDLISMHLVLNYEEGTYELRFGYIPNIGELITYGEQYLTDEQQAQVRSNIGAGTSDFDGNFNDLTNRPQYNGSPITSSTNIPYVPDYYIEDVWEEDDALNIKWNDNVMVIFNKRTDSEIHDMGYLKLADLPIWDGGVIDVN